MGYTIDFVNKPDDVVFLAYDKYAKDVDCIVKKTTGKLNVKFFEIGKGSRFGTMTVFDCFTDSGKYRGAIAVSPDYHCVGPVIKNNGSKFDCRRLAKLRLINVVDAKKQRSLKWQR